MHRSAIFTGRQAGRQAGRRTGRQAGKQVGRQAGRQAGRVMEMKSRGLLLSAHPTENERRTLRAKESMRHRCLKQLLLFFILSYNFS
jgi:phosphoenolpyruvate carboxylase